KRPALVANSIFAEKRSHQKCKIESKKRPAFVENTDRLL
ncbi:MAG: hypothetical protein ACI86M_000597, partial [Saprospiraceae bacterium]